MGREFELKYCCSAEDFEALMAAYTGYTAIGMETTYYDTADGLLGSFNWTLRTRLENGKSVCTLKTPLPDGSRGEWELDCEDIYEAIPALIKAGAPKDLEKYARDLVVVCGAKFTRLALTLEVPGATVELALDKGKLLGGGRELALQEVEVEVKDGSDDAAVAFAKTLEETYHLVVEKRSKYKRALMLAKGLL